MGVLLSLYAFSQGNKEIVVRQFERLQGEWDGFYEQYTEEDNKTHYSMLARCTSKYEENRWLFDVQYDDNGEIVGGGGDYVINDEGTKIKDYGGIVWDIVNVEEKGDSVKIVIETKGKENRKKATIRQTIDITSTTFLIAMDSKYDDGTAYIMRNRHLFRKKK
jgi:hypothetical protein